jgi:hypothetical protein
MQEPVTRGHAEVSAVPICWKNNSGVFVPNERPIHLELDSLSADLSLETARHLIAQLTCAVNRADDVLGILETPAGMGP